MREGKERTERSAGVARVVAHIKRIELEKRQMKIEDTRAPLLCLSEKGRIIEKGIGKGLPGSGEISR